MAAKILTTDAQALANRFTLPELRHEAHNADVHALPDWDDFPYWSWYKDTIAEAINLKQNNQPKPKPISGHIDVEGIKARADIVATIESYGIELKKAGHNFKVCCPFHNEKTPSFTVYPDENRWHCYGCQANGDVFAFVMKMENCDFKTAAAKVGGVL